jgi:hypothetical protein
VGHGVGADPADRFTYGRSSTSPSFMRVTTARSICAPVTSPKVNKELRGCCATVRWISSSNKNISFGRTPAKVTQQDLVPSMSDE